MKKRIKLNESQLKNIIKRIIKEGAFDLQPKQDEIDAQNAMSWDMFDNVNDGGDVSDDIAYGELGNRSQGNAPLEAGADGYYDLNYNDGALGMSAQGMSDDLTDDESNAYTNYGQNDMWQSQINESRLNNIVKRSVKKVLSEGLNAPDKGNIVPEQVARLFKF